MFFRARGKNIKNIDAKHTFLFLSTLSGSNSDLSVVYLNPLADCGYE